MISRGTKIWGLKLYLGFKTLKLELEADTRPSSQADLYSPHYRSPACPARKSIQVQAACRDVGSKLVQSLGSRQSFKELPVER